jgi:putative transposase
VRYRASRPLEGAIAQVTIKREGDHWFITFVCHSENPLPTPNVYNNTTVGIDMGIKYFAVLSTGEYIENPQCLKKELRKLAREQRKLDRKKYRCSTYKKQRKKVAKIHSGVKNKRKDFLHKISTYIVKNHDAIAVENLNISGMIKNLEIYR